MPDGDGPKKKKSFTAGSQDSKSLSIIYGLFDASAVSVCCEVKHGWSTAVKTTRAAEWKPISASVQVAANTNRSSTLKKYQVQDSGWFRKWEWEPAQSRGLDQRVPTQFVFFFFWNNQFCVTEGKLQTANLSRSIWYPTQQQLVTPESMSDLEIHPWRDKLPR